MSSKAWGATGGEITLTSHRGRRRFITGALAIGLGTVAGWAVLPRDQTHAETATPAGKIVPRGLPAIGQPAPDFTLPALHHDPQRLAAWRGQPVLINFWASWCGPCRREMPDLIAAYAQYQTEGLMVLAVNLTQQDSRANAAAFAEEFQIPFPVLLDDTGEVADGLYGAHALPMSYFIDRAGYLRHIYVGAVNRSWIGQIMEEIHDA